MGLGRLNDGFDKDSKETQTQKEEGKNVIHEIRIIMTDAVILAIVAAVPSIISAIGIVVGQVSRARIATNLKQQEEQVASKLEDQNTRTDQLHKENQEQLSRQDEKLVMIHKDINGRVAEAISAQVANQINDAVRIAVAEERARVAKERKK